MPTLQTETESGIPFTTTAMADTSSPLPRLRLVRHHVDEATLTLAEINVPPVAHTEAMEKTDADRSNLIWLIKTANHKGR